MIVIIFFVILMQTKGVNMKKIFLIFLLVGFAYSQTKMQKLVIAAPFSSVSHPFARMLQTNALSDIADKVELKIWKNPDELRALSLNNNANFIAVPTNVAANLYNKGVKIKLLNVSVWGILGILSRDKNIKSLKDFENKELLVPFRGDMPDIVLKTLLKKQNISHVKIKYIASPIDAMQTLITRRADHALLAEPAISMALRKTNSFPLSVIAPDLYRSVDLQDEWGKVFNKKPLIPQAGIAVLGDVDTKIIDKFISEYEKALKWYMQNKNEAGELVQKYFPMLKANAVSDSILHVKLKSVSAKDAKDDLEFFYEILKQDNAKLIGSKLPNNGFYY